MKQWVTDASADFNTISKPASQNIKSIIGNRSDDTLHILERLSKDVPFAKTEKSLKELDKEKYKRFGYAKSLEGSNPSHVKSGWIDLLNRYTEFVIADTNRESQLDRKADKKTDKDRLAKPVRVTSAFISEDVGKNNSQELQTSQVTQSLERIVEQLSNIETRLLEAAAASGQKEKVDDPCIQWLEDEDLTGRLQKILKRQAKRKGIDLT